jgi:hypothetical protein
VVAAGVSSASPVGFIVLGDRGHTRRHALADLLVRVRRERPPRLRLGLDRTTARTRDGTEHSQDDSEARPAASSGTAAAVQSAARHPRRGTLAEPSIYSVDARRVRVHLRVLHPPPWCTRSSRADQRLAVPPTAPRQLAHRPFGPDARRRRRVRYCGHPAPGSSRGGPARP